MARTNTPVRRTPVTTHEGGKAALHLTPIQQLRRTVLSAMLFEDEFYEDGQSIHTRIHALGRQIPLRDLAALAIEARHQHNLRHVSLALLMPLIQRVGEWDKNVIAETPAQIIAHVVSRADEITELLALYWKVNGADAPIAAQLKKGLAQALTKFDAYQLAKYDRANAVRLRDVLRLVHPVPKDEAQAKLWGQLKDGTLPSPDTWEVALSGGADKKETFERLLTENKLGYLALLRNLRNMVEAGVDRKLVMDAIAARKGAQKVLPFRYTAAARHAPAFEPVLDAALQEAILELPKLPGTTVVLVDVSGSMDYKLSAKSDLSRMDAAATLASVINAEDLRVFSFSHTAVEVPARRGMAGVEAVIRSQPHGGTYLAEAIRQVNTKVPKYDRLIVITDEQSHDGITAPKAGARGYLINVASFQNGVGYGKNWVHLDGFSERVLHWIHEYEAQEAK